MFEYRCGFKLKNTTVDAAALKLLRKRFPNASLAELRGKIQAHDYIYRSDMEKYDGVRAVAKLLREFAFPSIMAALVGSLYNIVDQIFI